MPRATKEASEQTAREILRIATTHFCEYGYGSTDLNTIAQAAGVTRGAVYHHYAGKAALFEAVVTALHRRLQNEIETSTAALDDPWEQLEIGSIAFIDEAIDPEIMRILLIEAPAVLGWETWHRLDEVASFQSLTSLLAEMEANGEIASGSAAASARLLSGAMNEAIMWIAAADDQLSARQEVTNVLRTMIRSLRISSSRTD